MATVNRGGTARVKPPELGAMATACHWYVLNTHMPCVLQCKASTDRTVEMLLVLYNSLRRLEFQLWHLPPAGTCRPPAGSHWLTTTSRHYYVQLNSVSLASTSCRLIATCRGLNPPASITAVNLAYAPANLWPHSQTAPAPAAAANVWQLVLLLPQAHHAARPVRSMLLLQQAPVHVDPCCLRTCQL